MKQQNRILDYLVFWLTTLFYLFIFSIVISTYTPLKLIKTKYASKYLFNIIYQIRWNVYVKQPWEPVYKLYALPNNIPVYQDLRPFQSKYLYGLRREYKVVFSEINVLYADTIGLSKMIKYEITMPEDGDLKDYINVDTLQFNTVSYENILYLKGRHLLSIGPPMSWEEARKREHKMKSFTIVPLNIQQPK